MDKRLGRLADIKEGDEVIIRKSGKYYECKCVRVTPTGQMTVLFNTTKMRFNPRGFVMGSHDRWARSSAHLLGTKEALKDAIEAEQKRELLAQTRRRVRFSLDGLGVFLHKIQNVEDAERVLALVAEIKTICEESQS